jgi:hypothetical protein
MPTETAVLLGLSLALWLFVVVVTSIKSPVLGMVIAVPAFGVSVIAANWIISHPAQVAVAVGISAAVVAFVAALVTADRTETVAQAVAGYNRGDNKHRDFLMKDGNTISVQYYSGYINPDDVASTSRNPAGDWRWLNG